MFKAISIFMNMVSSFDQYGGKVQLKFKGERDVKNFAGALISIFSFALSLYLSWSTFSDFLFKTNPNVATTIVYDTNTTNFNSSSLFFALSFFSPNSDTKSRQISYDSNNRTVSYLLHPIGIGCTTCDVSEDTELRLCNPDIYKDIKLKSMSDTKSKNILKVFQNYSYCLPDGFNGTLMDNLNSDIAQDSSLQFHIPFSTTPVVFADMKSNTENTLASSDISNILSTKQTPTIIPPVVKPVAPSPPPDTNPTKSQADPTQSNTQPGASNTQPVTSNGMPVASNTQPVASNTQPVPSNVQPVASNTQPVPSSVQPVPSNTQPVPSNVQPVASNTQPVQSNTQPATSNTQPAASNTQPATSQSLPSTSSITPSSTTPTTPTTPTTNSSIEASTTTVTPSSTPTFTPISSQISPKPVRLNSNPKLINTPRKLQSVTSGDFVEETSYNFIKTQMIKQKFPKILIIHKDIEINPNNDPKNIGISAYNFEILDYSSPIIDNPIVYDVIIQSVTISIVFPGLITFSSNDITYQSIVSISKNELDSLNNDGAYLTFKLLSDSKTITITYVSFTDFLGALGGYLAIFQMIAGLITSLWSDTYMKRKILNQIFQFVNNEPNNEKFYPNSKFKSSRKSFDNNQKIKDLESTDLKNCKRSITDKNGSSDLTRRKLLDNTKSQLQDYCRPVDIVEVQIRMNNEIDSLKIEENQDEIPMIIMNELILEQSQFLNIESKIGKEQTLINYDSESKKITKSIPRSKILPLYRREEIEMANLKLEKKEEKNKFDIYVKQIDEINLLKLKRKKKYMVSLLDLNIINLCGCDCNRDKKFYKKFKIINKCDEMIEEMLDVNYQIRLFSQFNLLKNYIFNSREKSVFNQLFKTINLNDDKRSMQYLKLIYDKPMRNFNYGKYEKLVKTEGGINKEEKLLEEYLDIFNF